MRNDELLSASEEKLIEYYESQIAPHVGIAASTLLSELQRRAPMRLISATEQVRESGERLTENTDRLLTETARVANSSAKLAESSDRLERYTVWLIVLTLLVLLVAAPPAIETVVRWLD